MNLNEAFIKAIRQYRSNKTYTNNPDFKYTKDYFKSIKKELLETESEEMEDEEDDE